MSAIDKLYLSHVELSDQEDVTISLLIVHVVHVCMLCMYACCACLHVM